MASVSGKFFQEVMQSKGVRWISFGWASFITENVIVSDNRTQIIEAFGDDTYHALYSLLSTAAMGSIGYGYIRYGRGMGPQLSRPISSVNGYLLQSMGLMGLSQLLPKFQIPVEASNDVEKSPVPSSTTSFSLPSFTLPTSFSLRCPMDFKPKDVPADGIYGMDRISRHAALWSFGFICLGHAATTVMVTEIVMGSWPVVFAYIGGRHQDHRYRQNRGGSLTEEKEEKTSNIPFVALLTGKQSWEPLLTEIKWENAGISNPKILTLTMIQSF
jgi:uncharacterized membrane protein